MKLIKRLAVTLLLLILVVVAHIFISTGYFRSIENKFDGVVVKKIYLDGAEDITISVKDEFALISATARKKIPSTVEEFGGLHLVDLQSDSYTVTNLTENFKKPFAPHGISMIQIDNTYKVLAINHTAKGHFIEVFRLNDSNLTHIETLKDDLIYSPNDLVMIDENRFYFTNDHKYIDGISRLAEDYLGLEASNVIYYDGEKYKEVADGIAYANGINYDSERNLLFVASPRKFLVKVYSRNDDGSLTFIEDIDCDTGVDNIEFDVEGNLWIGAHPNLLRFAAYAKGKKETSPSELLKLNYRGKNDYSIESIYVNDGTEMSASTVAAPYQDLILTGNVMDSHLLVLKHTN